MTTTNVTFRLRRDTTANWALYNPVLQAGEIGIDTTLNKFKIGNGVATFSALVFASILATDTAVSGLSATAAQTYVPDTLVGNPDGIATLDANGLVPISQLANLVDAAPTALNTLNELAAALGDDANFSTTVTNSLGTLNTKVNQFDARIVSLELGLGI